MNDPIMVQLFVLSSFEIVFVFLWCFIDKKEDPMKA